MFDFDKMYEHAFSLATMAYELDSSHLKNMNTMRIYLFAVGAAKAAMGEWEYNRRWEEYIKMHRDIVHTRHVHIPTPTFYEGQKWSRIEEAIKEMEEPNERLDT